LEGVCRSWHTNLIIRGRIYGSGLTKRMRARGNTPIPIFKKGAKRGRSPRGLWRVREVRPVLPMQEVLTKLEKKSAKRKGAG